MPETVLQTITNDQKGIWLNTSTTSTATWSRLGEGINSFTPSVNGQVSTKHYINAKNATSKRNGTQKQYSFSGDRVVGDACNDFIVGVADKTGSACETDLVIADLIAGTAGSGSTTYSGKKYRCMIDVSNDGSVEGGADVAIDGTIYVNGDPSTVTVSINDSTGAVTIS